MPLSTFAGALNCRRSILAGTCTADILLPSGTDNRYKAARKKNTFTFYNQPQAYDCKLSKLKSLRRRESTEPIES